MNHIKGSAIRLFLGVDEATGTTAFVDYVKNPNGTELLSDQAMSSTTSPSVGFNYVWQSLTSYDAGKYTVRYKTVNGIYTNYKDAHFYLGD